ncbi:MAG: curli biogenesis system outer membrane secretion channel CsgG [Chlamydiales bacterium]|jgi:curli biogenesis system outer membrane secretion channel CsgG
MSRLNPTLALLLPLVIGGLTVGCQTTSASSSRDTSTDHVGVYSAGPAGVAYPRVGIPSFKVTGKDAKEEMSAVAADQISTLLVRSKRFTVIERSMLDQIFEEQGLGDVVSDGQLAQAGEINGVDYLLLGKVTNLSAKVSKTNSSSGGWLKNLGGNAFGGAVANASLDLSKVTITTSCGVDLRLVSPVTGQVVTSNFSDFKESLSASALGVDFRGYKADSGAELEVSEEDYGKIMRLALDDAVRKMLPDIDELLMSKYSEPAE